MPHKASALTLRDVYSLGEQLEADRELPAATLSERDHAIGRSCGERDDIESLRYWLQAVATADSAPPWLSETQAALLLRMLALLAGAMAVGGFLLASDRALVNVFLFLLVFVALPLLFAALAAGVMLRAAFGRPSPVSPFNPTRFVARRALPGQAKLLESSAAVRLLALRYGQELGMLFAVGLMLAFMVLLAFTDFSFVWGSTFGFSDAAVNSAITALAAPWSSWLPQAVVPATVVIDTRYHAAQLDFSQLSEASRRGWWPFLFMCLTVYSLLPRLLLWLASRRLYRRELTRSFLGLPGAAAVLSRMRSPVVRTQAGDPEHVDARLSAMTYDGATLLLEWAGSLADTGDVSLRLAKDDNHLRAGLGSPADDLDSIELINRRRPNLLLVAVKSWEPPMADLADVLADIEGVSQCILQLVPLKGRKVSEANLRDWKAFARKLKFAATEVQPLEGLA